MADISHTTFFKFIFLVENCCILIESSLNVILKGLDNGLELSRRQAIIWNDEVLVYLLLHICVMGPQWIKSVIMLHAYPNSNVGWANVGPTSRRQYRRWANVGPTFIAVWVGSLIVIHISEHQTLFSPELIFHFAAWTFRCWQKKMWLIMAVRAVVLLQH